VFHTVYFREININKGGFMANIICLVIGILVGAVGSWIVSARYVAGLRKNITKLQVELIITKVSAAQMTEMMEKSKDQRMIQASERS
jgi:hypothetical protein